MTSDTRLEPGCTYGTPITITASHVTLDCRGAVVDGIGQSGVGIEVSTPDDQDLSDVTIRNCDVEGFTHGMRVTRVGFHTLPAGGRYVTALASDPGGGPLPPPADLAYPTVGAEAACTG